MAGGPGAASVRLVEDEGEHTLEVTWRESN
jgi:hypothetical protein